MQLSFLGQSYTARHSTISTTEHQRHGQYRGQSTKLTPEASELPTPQQEFKYRGAAYLGR